MKIEFLDPISCRMHLATLIFMEFFDKNVKFRKFWYKNSFYSFCLKKWPNHYHSDLRLEKSVWKSSWLARKVCGNEKKVRGVYNFSSLYGLLCFWVIYALKRRRADSRDLIKKVYFAMKIQISQLSARCPLMVCIGNNDKWPAPTWVFNEGCNGPQQL